MDTRFLDATLIMTSEFRMVPAKTITFQCCSISNIQSSLSVVQSNIHSLAYLCNPQRLIKDTQLTPLTEYNYAGPISPQPSNMMHKIKTNAKTFSCNNIPPQQIQKVLPAYASTPNLRILPSSNVSQISKQQKIA